MIFYKVTVHLRWDYCPNWGWEEWYDALTRPHTHNFLYSRKSVKKLKPVIWFGSGMFSKGKTCTEGSVPGWRCSVKTLGAGTYLEEVSPCRHALERVYWHPGPFLLLCLVHGHHEVSIFPHLESSTMKFLPLHRRKAMESAEIYD